MKFFKVAPQYYYGKKLSQLFIACLTLTLLTGQVVYGQRSQSIPVGNTSLLSNDCRDTGPGRFYKDERFIVSIGRQAFDSLFHFDLISPNNAPKVLSCRFKKINNSPTTLQVSFGIEDSDSVDTIARVTVYLDGNPTASHTFSAGNLKTVVLDVTKIRSVGIEVSCERGRVGVPNDNSCPNIWFTKASIIPTSR
jgi:hypothetical protein